FAGETLAVETWLDAVGAPYDDLGRTGRRIWNLVRLFNVREGFDRADDALPEVVDPEELSVEFEATLDRYYAARGWSEAGIPAQETLDRLDLLEAVDEETPVASNPMTLDDD
ncbi:MAG: aldehyde ferredoxin oxidoreductase C-terminal domain-containing protein, partial [Natronomonas sp.]